MTSSKDPQAYLMIAGGLAFCAGTITYCAVNWDDPPNWWPNILQSWWNKKETDSKDKNKIPECEKKTYVLDDGNDEGSDIEVEEVTKNIDITFTEK